MAQVTDSLLAEFQARVDRGEHINSTVYEEAQLLHAFREWKQMRPYAEAIRELLEEANCPNGMCDQTGTVYYYQKGERVPEPCQWCAKRAAALAKNPNPSEVAK